VYLDAEAETGYVRDRNVFGAPITIEDTMAATARPVPAGGIAR
jgi:hypothetical protein